MGGIIIPFIWQKSELSRKYAGNLFRVIRDNRPRAPRAIGAPLSILKTPVARGFRLNRNVGGVLPGFGPVGKNFLWRSN